MGDSKEIELVILYIFLIYMDFKRVFFVPESFFIVLIEIYY